MIFAHLPTISIEQDGLYATACGKVFWVERETTYYNAVPQFVVGRESLSWRESGNILCAFNSTETEYADSYRIVAFLSKVKLGGPPTGHEYVGGHPTFGRVSESSFWMGVSGTKVGTYTMDGAIASSHMTPFEKDKIGVARILLKQTSSTTPDLPKEDPEEYVDITDLFPDMYARTGIDEFKADHSNLGWMRQTKDHCRVDARRGNTIGKNYARYKLRHRCKRKDLPKENSVSVVNTTDKPIFNDAPTCPIDQEGGWYVTADGSVIELEPVHPSVYSHPEHHKPVNKIHDKFNITEAFWWHTNGDIYMQNQAYKNLCQPALRIVAKLINFTRELPSGFKFKGGHPHFSKIDNAKRCAWVAIDCVKNQKILAYKVTSSGSFVYGSDVTKPDEYSMIGAARIFVEKTESTKQEVVAKPSDLLFGDKPTIPFYGAGVYITADGSVAIIDKDGYDRDTEFKISETSSSFNISWNADGTTKHNYRNNELRLVAKIYHNAITHIADKTGKCSLINTKMRPFSSSNGFSHYIGMSRVCNMIAVDKSDSFFRPVTLLPAPLNFFGQNRIFVNPVPTPILKEEATMAPVQEAPKPQNPVIQIAKATGNFAVRGANYWLAQPTMIMGGYAVRSLRFIFASAVIGSVVGSINYPDTAKKFAASLIPKVEVKIEKPSILK